MHSTRIPKYDWLQVLDDNSGEQEDTITSRDFKSFDGQYARNLSRSRISGHETVFCLWGDDDFPLCLCDSTQFLLEFEAFSFFDRKTDYYFGTTRYPDKIVQEIDII